MQRDELFPSGIVLPREIKKSCIESIFQAIKKELPEEALTVEVLEYIANELKDKAHSLQIRL